MRLKFLLAQICLCICSSVISQDGMDRNEEFISKKHLDNFIFFSEALIQNIREGKTPVYTLDLKNKRLEKRVTSDNLKTLFAIPEYTDEEQLDGKTYYFTNREFHTFSFDLSRAPSMPSDIIRVHYLNVYLPSWASMTGISEYKFSIKWDDVIAYAKSMDLWVSKNGHIMFWKKSIPSTDYDYLSDFISMKGNKLIKKYTLQAKQENCITFHDKVDLNKYNYDYLNFGFAYKQKGKYQSVQTLGIYKDEANESLFDIDLKCLPLGKDQDASIIHIADYLLALPEGKYDYEDKDRLDAYNISHEGAFNDGTKDKLSPNGFTSNIPDKPIIGQPSKVMVELEEELAFEPEQNAYYFGDGKDFMKALFQLAIKKDIPFYTVSDREFTELSLHKKLDNIFGVEEIEAPIMEDSDDDWGLPKKEQKQKTENKDKKLEGINLDYYNIDRIGSFLARYKVIADFKGKKVEHHLKQIVVTIPAYLTIKGIEEYVGYFNWKDIENEIAALKDGDKYIEALTNKKGVFFLRKANNLKGVE